MPAPEASLGYTKSCHNNFLEALGETVNRQAQVTAGLSQSGFPHVL